MSKLRPTRSAQRVMSAEFVFSFNDTMEDINGVEKSFGSTHADQGTFDVIPMPVGAVIVGGEVIVETAGVGPTAYTMDVGTAASGAALANDVNLKSAARTALTVAALACNAGEKVRIAIASTEANATAGKVRVRVNYTIDGKADDVL